MAAIGSIIKGFDGSDELAQTQREVVESLSKLGEARAEFFDLTLKEKLRTAGQEGNQTVPISAILTSTRQVRAYSSSSAGNIAEEIKKALQGFVKGTSEGIIDGVTTLISSALTVFLGEASASTGTISDYYVLTSGLSVLRIDLMAWYQNVTAKSIYTKMERVSAFIAVKSVVDLAKLDFFTFLYLYEQQLVNGKVPPGDVKKALADVKEIYEDFRKAGGKQLEGVTTVTAHPGLASGAVA
ncbi:MAG TPA: hypothetical protein VNR42_09600 [Solirubrobacteraceae bacterium]|nr:hypothetical protein [Solirubrobacteraceae bacterium]